MISKSPFIVVDSSSKNEELVFSAQTQKIYTFSSCLDDIIYIADHNIALQEKLDRLGLISYEKDYYKAIGEFEIKKTNRSKKSLQICYNVTTKCNLHCRYCFQNHITRTTTTIEIIERTVKLIDKTLANDKNIKVVILYLFGGDPMMRTDLCLNLLNGFRKICEYRRVNLYPIMATNGIIGTLDVWKNLKEAGLNNLQVSFDGPREIHNETRGNTYNIIMENLPLLSAFFTLSIKYNINKKNIENFTEFLSDIKSIRFSHPYIITLEALHKTLTYNNSFYLYDYEDSALAKALLTLLHLCIQNGIPYDISTFFEPPCMATSTNSFMIEPNGYISNCITSYNMESFNIGHIFDLNHLNFSKENINSSIKKAASTLCYGKKCPFFPVCETGCLYQKHLKEIGFDHPLCRQQFYFTLVRGLINIKRAQRRKGRI